MCYESHPLDGARLKIVRAQQHLKVFRARIGRHLRQNTEEIVKNINEHTVEHTKRLSAPVPHEYSVIVGDVLTNSRAALDYVLWELIDRYFDPRFDSRNRNDRRVASFPTDPLMTSKDYSERLLCLANRKIPAAAIDQIKSVHPKQSGYEPLGILHKLVNTDKHRALILTDIGGGGQATFDMEMVREQLRSGKRRILGIMDTVTLRADADGRTVIKNKMDVNVQPTIFIAFKDESLPRKSAVVLLEEIIETTGRIIPMFDCFF